MSQEHKAQAERILAVLEAHRGAWVSVFELLDATHSLSLTRRISDARERIKPRGLAIENELRDGGHSFYRLVKQEPEQLKLLEVA